MAALKKVARATRRTKEMLASNGHNETRFRNAFDRLLDGAEELDRATWSLVRDGKDRLYHVMDLVAVEARKAGQSTQAVRASWNDLSHTALEVSGDVAQAARRVRNRAQTRTRAAVRRVRRLRHRTPAAAKTS